MSFIQSIRLVVTCCLLVTGVMVESATLIILIKRPSIKLQITKLSSYSSTYIIRLLLPNYTQLRLTSLANPFKLTEVTWVYYYYFFFLNLNKLTNMTIPAAVNNCVDLLSLDTETGTVREKNKQINLLKKTIKYRTSSHVIMKLSVWVLATKHTTDRQNNQTTGNNNWKCGQHCSHQ